MSSKSKKRSAEEEPEQEERKNKRKRTLFLGNLPSAINHNALKEFFEDVGELTEIRLGDKRLKGSGFVTFETQKEADKAVAMTRTEVWGQPIKITYSKPLSTTTQSKPPGCTTVFVGNLSHKKDDNELEKKMKEFFRGCGEIAEISFKRKRKTIKGFVKFLNPDKSLDLAIAKNGTTCMSRRLRVSYAKPKPP